jgi:hypothetical protein
VGAVAQKFGLPRDLFEPLREWPFLALERDASVLSGLYIRRFGECRETDDDGLWAAMALEPRSTREGGETAQPCA